MTPKGPDGDVEKHWLGGNVKKAMNRSRRQKITKQKHRTDKAFRTLCHPVSSMGDTPMAHLLSTVVLFLGLLSQEE